MKITYLVIIILFSSCYPVKKPIRLNNNQPKIDTEYIILKNNKISIFIIKDNLLKKLTEKDDDVFKEKVISYINETKTLSLPESNMETKSKETAFIFYFVYNEVLNGNVKIIYNDNLRKFNVKKITYHKIKGDLGSVHSYFQYKDIIFLRYLHSLGE